MREILSGNISRYRRAAGLTQEGLASQLGITFQAVSKWETGQAVPDTTMLPKLAHILKISVDKLLGYSSAYQEASYYEHQYRQEEYYWGVEPNDLCLKLLKRMPPTKPWKLLDIGCGEGKDAVFLARCGYDVSAFDISATGLKKAGRLAAQAKVQIETVRADIWDFRLDTDYDILYSSGVLHYIRPDLRDEIMANYQAHLNPNGLAVLQVFVDKPFIDEPPEKEENSFLWKSGQLLTYFHDWYIEDFSEYVFDCDSSGIAHQHAVNIMVARKKKTI
jgi:tellurite methyltransferase